MHWFAQTSTGQGFVLLATVFGAATLLVVALMIAWRLMANARRKQMQTWAQTGGYDWQPAVPSTEWFEQSTLKQRLRKPYLLQYCRRNDTEVADVEYQQLQVSGVDARGATVVAIRLRKDALPAFRLIPDAWDPMDGPEPIRRGLSSGSATTLDGDDNPFNAVNPGSFDDALKAGSFDDTPTQERRKGMLCSGGLDELPQPYLLTDCGNESWLRQGLLEALRDADGLRFEGAGTWVIGYTDRRVGTDELDAMIDRVRRVAEAIERVK